MKFRFHIGASRVTITLENNTVRDFSADGFIKMLNIVVIVQSFY